MNSHRKLLAWQACRELIRAVYRASRTFPADERFGLTSQFRRAAVSTASNIAEGCARGTPREFAHGVRIALGSLAEVDTLLAVAEDEGYLAGKQLAEISRLRERASQLTAGLLRQLTRRIAA
jgi:four helix bundle protein